MAERIIITDLTRFKEGNPSVCTAGVTTEGELIRPYPPYLQAKDCERLDIHPGAILEGEFTRSNSPAPHIEDATWSNLHYVDKCSSSEFQKALESGLHNSILNGFECAIPNGERYIPPANAPVRSIITIRLHPNRFSIVGDGFNPKKIRANFWDNDGTQYSFIPITDRGFSDRALKIQGDNSEIAQMNFYVQSQEELYLRIGLSRPYEAPNKKYGYWIQVNGIYTFPEYMDYIRCYDIEES